MERCSSLSFQTDRAEPVHLDGESGGHRTEERIGLETELRLRLLGDWVKEGDGKMMFWIIFFSVLAVLAAGYFFPFCRLHRDGRNVSEICGMELCAPRSVERGGGSSGEFSLPAFARAAEQGYAIELDIQITKDGRIVVFHDDTMKRMCGNEGKNQRLYV